MTKIQSPGRDQAGNAAYERPNTVSLPSLLTQGRDTRFREMIYDLDRLASLIQETRKNISQSLGLTPPEFNALMVIAELQEDSGVTVGDLARRLQVSSPFATIQARRLVERGLVEKRDNPADRRQTLLVLTAEGCSMFDRLAPSLRAFNDRTFRSLDRDSFESFRQIMQSIIIDWKRTRLDDAGA